MITRLYDDLKKVGIPLEYPKKNILDDINDLSAAPFLGSLTSMSKFRLLLVSFERISISFG